MKPALSLLSRLWLAEPDERTLAAARGAGFSGADPAALSLAWTDLFLLNVYPYATAFTDVPGELNGPASAAALARYEAAGFCPPELSSVGAPDHAGLCLGYLAFLSEQGRGDQGFLSWLLDWLPACSLAVERQPAVHPFYGELAAATRRALLEAASDRDFVSRPSDDFASIAESGDAEDEDDLSRVLRFLLAPAACGVFLSRSRLGTLALEAGLRLPFGSRFDVARALFEAAGECGRVEPVLDALSREALAWSEAYSAIAGECPRWGARAVRWRERVAATQDRVSEMKLALRRPLASSC